VVNDTLKHFSLSAASGRVTDLVLRNRLGGLRGVKSVGCRESLLLRFLALATDDGDEDHEADSANQERLRTATDATTR